MEKEEKDEMREEGREESDDRTISHPHGYWFSGTGYSKFGRKPRAEASCSRGDRLRLLFVFRCLSADVCLCGVRLRSVSVCRVQR